MWRIFSSAAHFKSVAHFLQCVPLLNVWHIFVGVVHFFKCFGRFQVWRTFSSVAHF